jgi:hypothetical protein
MSKTLPKNRKAVAKNAPTIPAVTIRFDEPELAEVYTAIEAQGKPAERNATAQVRFILKEWAKAQGVLA